MSTEINYPIAHNDEKANREQEEWITPTLLNGWEEFSVTQKPQFIKDDFGFVRLRGMVKNGSSSILFSLPIGYRPSGTNYFIINNTMSPRQITISATGTLLINSGYSTGWASLDGIAYKVEG